MVFALLILGGGAGGLVALATLLTFGIGPVAALLIFWLGGLATTFVLAVSLVRSTSFAMTDEELSSTKELR